MFAGKPPPSSKLTKRLSRKIVSNLMSFVGFLLQIGGANIAARGTFQFGLISCAEES